MPPSSPAPTRALILITVSGPDGPGITGALSQVLAQHAVELLDVGQAVIHGLLSLSFLIALPSATAPDSGPGEGGPPVLKDLLFRAAELGLRMDFRVLGDSLARTAGSPPAAPAQRLAITLIGQPVSARALARVTQCLAERQINIDRIDRLSEVPLGDPASSIGPRCIELRASSSSVAAEALRPDLYRVAREVGVDIAVQSDGVYRRAKRLVVMDMDSTLIQGEVIDELARAHGCYAQVAEITARAMRGEIDFDASLRARVALLRGLPEGRVYDVFDEVQLMPGAVELVQALQRLGFRTAILSGSFGCVAERLRERLGVDWAHANELEIVGGQLTGRVREPIVNAERKAELLSEIAAREGIALDQTIAIGDGANDILMLERAGLGIAFNAKPAVRERADFALNQASLRTVLYLLGIPDRDLPSLTLGSATSLK